MKLVLTLIWSFLLITMLNYVVSSVANVPFDFQLGVIISLGVTAVIYILSVIIPNEPVVHENH